MVSIKPERGYSDCQRDERNARPGSSHEKPGHQGKTLRRDRKSVPDCHDKESIQREHCNDGNNYRQVDDVTSGLAKQRDMKADQPRKELERGSGKGQEMREDHRRKWWKYWE